MEKYKIVFVVGVPRSGTTWMMWLLTHHPSVVSGFHTRVIHSLHLLKTWWKENKKYAEKALYSVMKSPSTDLKETERKFKSIKLNVVLEEEEFIRLARPIVQHIFDEMQNINPKSKVVVETTPENIEFMPLILKLFPEAYILHVVRDPRSIFASMRKAVRDWASADEFTKNPFSLANRWCSYMQMGKNINQETDRYREVRYEELYTNGVEELQHIYSWLGLSADQEFCEQVVAHTLFDKMKKLIDVPKNFFRRGTKSGWRKDLSHADAEVIEYIAGDKMEEKGFEREFGDLKSKPLSVRFYEIRNKVNLYQNILRVLRFIKKKIF